MKRMKMEIAREELFDANMMVAASVTVSGTAEHAQLETAFNKAVSSFEVLNTRIVIDASGAACYETSDLQENRLYYTEKSLEDLIREQEKLRFRIENGEYLRLFADDHRPGVLQLHFFLHHTGGDGKSLCYFVESFLKSLNGETPPARPLHLLTPASFPAGSRLNPLFRLYVNSWNRRWKKEGKVFGMEDLQKASSFFWQKHETELLHSTVAPDELETQLKECHENGISFTSRYISELLKETSSEKKIGLAVSIREKEDRTMGNLVTGLQLKHTYDPEAGLLANAKMISEQFGKKLEKPSRVYFALRLMNAFVPSLVDAVLLESAGVFHSRLTEKLAAQLRYSEKSKSLNHFNISNLGVLDIPLEYGSYRVDDFWFIPPNPSYARDVIGMVTVRGKLNIARHRYKGCQDTSH